MNDRSAHSGDRRHRLTTFGTLALIGPSDEIVFGSHGHHRRRLALLAVLAAAGDMGRSRDQLLPLFWPEATQTKARHSLEQLLYALRGSIDEAVFSGVNPLRLNPEVVENDIGAFSTALARGDLEAAVAVYRGPFLDGFYLTDAPEFERWVEGERSRLAARYADALERLARKATAARQHDTAARCWRALTELDPLSRRSAEGLIRALIAAEDHVAALQFAKRYEATLSLELGASVDPTIAALVADARAGARQAVEPQPEVSSPAAMEQREAEALGHTNAAATTAQGRDAPAMRGHRPPLLHVVAASLLLVGGAAGLLQSRARKPAAAPAHGGTRNVAAHELYVRASDPVALRSDSSARVALEQFEQAITLDDRYAAAYAGLALMQIRVPPDSLVSHRDRLALAEQAALRAVALDDSLAESHAALAFVRASDLDLASAESEIRRAIELSPTNAQFREWLAQLHVTNGQPVLALAEARRALELDPLSPTAVAEVAHALLANDRCDEALAQLAPLRSLHPPLLRAGSIAVQCYARKAMWPEAIAAARPIARLGGARGRSLLGWALGRAGHLEESHRVLDSLIADDRRTKGQAFDVAVVYAGLGDTDQAFAWLDRAADERSIMLHQHFGLISGLSGDPRFDHFRGRLRIARR